MPAGRILRFVGVGGLATLVHVVIALAARAALLLPELWANLAGFGAALAVSYAGHARCTFGVAMEAAQLPRFLMASLIGLATSSGVVWLAGTWFGWGFPAAMALVAVTVPAMTYLLLRFWVFDGRATADWPGLLIPAGIAGLLLVAVRGRMINHDTAWYLIATRKWLEGATLYSDIVEVNPPLNFYFTLPAIRLADVTGLSDTDAQYVLLALTLFASLHWSARLLRRAGLPAGRRMVLLAGIGAALVVPALDSLAQREHLLVLLLTPWLLGRLVAQPRRADLLQSAVAGLAICLKPFFLLFPLAVTLKEIVVTRSLRPVLSLSNLTMLAIGLGYVTFVARVHPAYLGDIVPVARAVYGGYGADAAKIWSRVAMPLPVFGIAALVLWREGAEPATRLFALAALAGLGCYFWQGTGFRYHLIPFLAFALIAGVWAVTAPGLGRAARLALLLLTVVASLHSLPRTFYQNATVAQIAEVGQGAESLLVISSHVYAGPPAALALGADWTSRFPAAWFVPGAVNGLRAADCDAAPDRCALLQGILKRARDEMLEDLERNRPDLIAIDRASGYIKDPGFSWNDFLGDDPRWPQILSRYQRVAQTSRFDIWRL